MILGKMEVPAEFTVFATGEPEEGVVPLCGITAFV